MLELNVAAFLGDLFPTIGHRGQGLVACPQSTVRRSRRLDGARRDRLCPLCDVGFSVTPLACLHSFAVFDPVAVAGLGAASGVVSADLGVGASWRTMPSGFVEIGVGDVGTIHVPGKTTVLALFSFE
ncbi:hypothetical protein [Bradyrhizobium iriomotense]|uniref:hypothetical protein n=1 Tax=Bradyrhizobium iriomotense TaxID=441950 RepID=UPI0024E0B88A|nr:hypothetical protein [Bradyrhizobium iriomotense]